jgi:TonB family protein
MPPTFKDSSALPTSPEKPGSSRGISSAIGETSSSQPVALDVRVTVNGARAVEGSEKREPFSETTNTVLVLANGAVIRLSASVEPGQLLFLTNEKTKKEVVCQVVKSKNYRSVSGYVELEFTEPVLGFWGLRFPGERHTAQAGTSLPAVRRSDPAPVSAGIPPTGKDAKPTPVVDASPVENVTPNLADAVHEFKTEIKGDSRSQSKADLLAPPEPSIDGLKLEANRLQEQLSALLFAEQKPSEAKPAVSAATPSKQELGDAAAKIFDIVNEEPSAAKLETTTAKSDLSSSAPPAPKNTRTPATSSFDDEELKIPAWLEPLARNAAIPAPPVDEGTSDSTPRVVERKASEAPKSASAPEHAAATIKNTPTKPRHTPAAPLFGNSLLSESTPEPARSHGSSKGIWMAIAAGLIVAAASGGWYFRDSLAALVPAHSTSESNPSAISAAPASHPAAPPVNSAALATPSLPLVATPDTSSSATKAKPGNALTEMSAPVSTPAQGKIQPAAITERILKSSSGNDVTNAPVNSAEPVEPEIKKPSLGKVRLAKPKVGRSAKVQANAEMEPALEGSSSTVLSAGENSLTNFAEGSNQPAAPAAPVLVGGDVKPARLISSAAPVYPALARNQHIAGDVRVDALIDATGRVTTMKVVSGPSLLHQAAMDALRQWKYQAATLDGKPTAMHLTVTIQFRLQ